MRWQALVQAKVNLPVPILMLANVGEEGEGDLRGVRHFYEQRELAGRVAAHVVLDGAGDDSAVSQALGSRRFQVSIKGPGGHSFTDSGTPNPIVALGSAIAVLARTPLPERPTTTLNVGTVQGGTSVNSVPESATASIDFRSTSSDELLRLEVALHRAVEDAVVQTNAAARNQNHRNRGVLTFTIDKIGDRPAARLPRILLCLRRFARWIGISEFRRICAWAPRMRTFPYLWEFRRFQSAQAETAVGHIRWPSGTRTRIARSGCGEFCC